MEKLIQLLGKHHNLKESWPHVVLKIRKFIVGKMKEMNGQILI